MTGTIHDKFEIINITDVKPDKANPRTHSATQVKKLADAIQRFGFTNPILIDEAGQIIAGHGRLAAAKVLGMQAVPVITVAGLTDAERKALLLADNRLAEDAGWSEDLLTDMLKDIQAEGIDLAATGFDESQLDKLLGTGDLEDLGADEGEGKSGINAIYLVVDKEKIPISETEKAALLQRLEAHIEHYGSPFGFVDSILGNGEPDAG